jgi:hypothetical protein
MLGIIRNDRKCLGEVGNVIICTILTVFRPLNFMYSFVLVVNKGFSGAQGRLFKILKTLIFSSSNPLDTCMIYFCREVNYSSFFLS